MGVYYDFLCSTETDTTGARWFLNFEKKNFDDIIVLAVPWTNIQHSDEMSLDLFMKWAFSIQTVFNTTIKLHVLKDLCI